MPKKMCIWIKAILMSFNPRVPKAGESIFPKTLQNIWMITTGISASCFQNAECFSRTGLIKLMVLLCLKKNFLRFWYSAFPEKKDSGVSIRAYDFRHHFVYADMNRWLRDGKDVNAMLPYLMRYMGHTDIKNTLYYFHLVPDIYGEIAARSEHSERLIPKVDDNEEN